MAILQFTHSLWCLYRCCVFVSGWFLGSRWERAALGRWWWPRLRGWTKKNPTVSLKWLSRCLNVSAHLLCDCKKEKRKQTLLGILCPMRNLMVCWALVSSTSTPKRVNRALVSHTIPQRVYSGSDPVFPLSSLQRANDQTSAKSVFFCILWSFLLFLAAVWWHVV